MGKYDDNFFVGKRPWSLIKDQILRDYIPAYLSKVKKLRCPIVLVDGYAGPGKFEDGEPGSPLIICSEAEKYAKGLYSAHFFNIKLAYHEKLEAIIKRAGWSNSANCYRGNSLKYIKHIPQILTNHTVFLYLDPFGLKGCGFDQLEPFLARDPNYSTEIVLTMCMPVVHRLASYHAVEKGLIDKRIERYHNTLSTVFGGDYWGKILFQQSTSAEDREIQLIEAYLDKLREYLPYAGYCPVRQRSDKRIKYFMVFVSRHPDTMLLMNDSMHKAYYSSMHEADYGGTLLEGINWRDMPMPEESSIRRLKMLILELLSQQNGESRDTIWLRVVQSKFMRFDHTLYLAAIKQLSDARKIEYDKDPLTKRHNGKSRLSILR